MSTTLAPAPPAAASSEQPEGHAWGLGAGGGAGEEAGQSTSADHRPAGDRSTTSKLARAVIIALVGWLVVAPLLTMGALLVVGVAITALSRQQVNCSVAGSAAQVSGVDLDAEQLANAQLIVTTVAGLGAPQRAAQIAVATAMQESSLRNVDHGDDAGPDSLGLFQQRAPYGPTRADPAAATTMFVQRLVAVPGWESMPLTLAAAQVQRPRADLRGEYARWETLATDLVTRYWPAIGSGPGAGGTTAAGAPDPGVGVTPGQAAETDPTALSVLSGQACLGPDGGGLAGPETAQPLPPGWTPVGTQAASTAITWALGQRGKPYVWGGVGPEGFDCSGLMMKAWAAAGVAIPRTTVGQRTTGIAVSGLDQLQPGDLLFIAGSEGTDAAPRHVGMYIGAVDGVPSFVQAPRTGDVVQVDPLTRWSKDIVAIRRPVTQ